MLCITWLLVIAQRLGAEWNVNNKWQLVETVRFDRVPSSGLSLSTALCPYRPKAAQCHTPRPNEDLDPVFFLCQ
eukprot:2731061-Lingulodinium_polyedra.AAC.1